MTRKIFEKQPTKRRISGEEFAKALGAEETSLKIDSRWSPMPLSYLRRLVAGKLRSRGGIKQ